jgi:hypothetical protein
MLWWRLPVIVLPTLQDLMPFLIRSYPLQSVSIHFICSFSLLKHLCQRFRLLWHSFPFCWAFLFPRSIGCSHCIALALFCHARYRWPSSPLALFSTLSSGEKPEFHFRCNSFCFISKRNGRRESLSSPDLVRIQRFVDYRDSNQVNHGVVIWCYCWKSYVWPGKRVSCVTWFSSPRPINNSAESERLMIHLSE